MRYVLHLTGLSHWRAGTGPLTPDSLEREGFVHASPDEATVLAVADALYADATEPQVVLVVDTERVEAPVRWEPPAPAPPPGAAADALFPHIYGPIPRAAVAEVRYARRDHRGSYVAVERRGPTAEHLDLLPHPEGGWYAATWRAPAAVRPEGYGGERATATAIHYLLHPGESSRWHRVRSDEVWVFNRGGPLELALGGAGSRPSAAPERVVLGTDIAAGQRLQAVVPGGTWQSARPVEPREARETREGQEPGEGQEAPVAEEALVTCVVSPGFDFADFEVWEES
ncbi:cupin domain-containing protein [Streptomonospora sp. S1-112]|uniref:Cupin domain-containing protein n=1 Tax=Streptomonospora mangrovi TaxID=2883123 RepID=A0A9X3NQB9_9ACTN|nr:cupin domain-containing protein [Streptomonospora mangrovi]MDA0567937.1 cupin domain-containing protein [Streptomonospora mangrovi]